MRGRRKRRRHDWLFADHIFFNLGLGAGLTGVHADVPLLPTEYIDQNAEGSCTLVRIVGDLQLWNFATGNSTEVSALNPYGVSFGIYVTQVDDTGVLQQIEIDPYDAPALGASASVGGARSFLWCRNFVTPFSVTPNATSFSNVGNAVSLAVNGGSTFDLRVKRKLTTGFGLGLHVNQAIATPDTVDLHTAGVLAYRLLVAR